MQYVKTEEDALVLQHLKKKIQDDSSYKLHGATVSHQCSVTLRNSEPLISSSILTS